MAAFADFPFTPAEAGGCGPAKPAAASSISGVGVPTLTRVPVAAELAYLLGIDLEKQVRAMYVACRCRMHVGDLDAAAGDGSEDPHQRALRVAIVDVECVHFCFSLELENQAGLCPADGQECPSPHDQNLLVVEQHLRKRCACGHHRINICLWSAVEYQ